MLVFCYTLVCQMLAFYSNYYEVKTMRSPRVPVEEQYLLIMACRKSGLSDHQWCLNNDINSGTFYNCVFLKILVFLLLFSCFLWYNKKYNHFSPVGTDPVIKEGSWKWSQADTESSCTDWLSSKESVRHIKWKDERCGRSVKSVGWG